MPAYYDFVYFDAEELYSRDYGWKREGLETALGFERKEGEKMKLIAVGDNVTDCYMDEQVYFPGGNAVNVAVNCKRNGAEAVEYIGILGDDDHGDWIRRCLKEEGVGMKRCRKVYGDSAKPRVYLKDGDRVFAPGPRDSCQHLFAIRIVPEDLELIRQFDVCHTSCYSNIEHELPALASVCRVSFDFSDKRDPDYIKRLCPFLTYAFFSGSDLKEDEIQLFMKEVYEAGAKIVGVTRGKLGSIFFDGDQFYEQGIKKVEVVDTMGAGDSFIAGFLTRYEETGDMRQALEYGAERSAITCTVRGGFGYPHVLKMLGN